MEEPAVDAAQRRGSLCSANEDSFCSQYSDDENAFFLALASSVYDDDDDEWSCSQQSNVSSSHSLTTAMMQVSIPHHLDFCPDVSYSSSSTPIDDEDCICVMETMRPVEKAWKLSVHSPTKKR